MGLETKCCWTEILILNYLSTWFKIHNTKYYTELYYIDLCIYNLLLLKPLKKQKINGVLHLNCLINLILNINHKTVQNFLRYVG